MIDGILLHSVSYAGLWGQDALSLSDFIDKAADLGFDGVELMAKRPHFSVLDYDETARAALRDHLDRRGLRHRILAGYNNFTADLGHAEVPMREIQVHYLTELARAASQIGASTVRVFTGYEDPAVPYGRQWDLVVASLREAADRAAQFGVVLGVQNHHDVAADTESFADLIREIDHPNCRAMFDAWAPALHGADLAAAAKLLAPVSTHTTVANYVRRSRFRYQPALVNYEPVAPRVVAVSMEDGFIDYAAFFDALEAQGFQGTAAYEICSPLRGGGSLENLDKHARLFLEYMRVRSPLAVSKR